MQNTFLKLYEFYERYNNKMVGLQQVGSEVIKIQSNPVAIVRYAAAVMLALSIAGAVPTIGWGAHPPPSPPLLEEDLDRDGLCDICEDEIYGTDPQLADTDGDGIPDGDEDHDGDGLSNIEELNQTVVLMDAVEIGDTEKVKALLEYSPYITSVRL